MLYICDKKSKDWSEGDIKIAFTITDWCPKLRLLREPRLRKNDSTYSIWRAAETAISQMQAIDR